MIDELRRRWNRTAKRLSLQDRASDELFDEIVKRHSERHRAYHGLAHLLALFNVLEPVSDAIKDAARVELAIWFHDIIYKPLRSDNEQKSADLAVKRLAEISVDRGLIERVDLLIRATADHQNGGSDSDDAIFLDADFSILGAPAETYDDYVAGVRKEYRLIPRQMFNSGRAKFLSQALAQDRIFHTEYFEKTFGAQARENMARELANIE
jgi:predicted metal-dependent HD superfamily phosphohydrolase